MKFMQKGQGLLPDSKRSILSFIVSLSKWLQLPTVAEGVETKDELELLRAMGCNYIQGYYFAKPMPIVDFEDYMVANRAPQPAVQPEDPANQGTLPLSAPATCRPCVLIAEDIEGNRALLKEILAPYCQLLVACNGAEAYELIAAHHAEISCILLDLLMPVMDGFQLLDKLKSDGYLSSIPVIITSEAGSNGELRALRLGADSFVAKPYDAEVLLHHVKKAIGEREFRMLREQLRQQTEPAGK